MSWALTQLIDAEDFDGQRPIPVGATIVWDGTRFIVVPEPVGGRIDARYPSSVNPDVVDAGGPSTVNADTIDAGAP